MELPRNAQLWLPGYLRGRLRERLRPDAGHQAHTVWLLLADHFEPLWQTRDEQLARRRVERWRREWPEIAARHRDSTGRPPVYTFFFPEEECRPGLLDPLAEMARLGIADVEIHLHHNGEGEQNFIDRITRFKESLSVRHGLLRQVDGRVVFGFVHGDWALDNSRPDGRMCGLNNEIFLLGRLGCYADFTMPSAPSPTQSRIVNRICWVRDDPERPRSFDRGIPLRPGESGTGDLLMVPGPLAIRWKDRLLPRLETGEIASYDRPTPYRARRWLDVAPRIGAHLFLKLFAHGAQEANSAALLHGGLEALFQLLAAECRRRQWNLRFASAWQMRQAIDAALRPPSDPIQHVR